MKRDTRTPRVLGALPAMALALACGGAANVREEAALPVPSAVEEAPEPEDDMATSAEIGGLDAAQAEATFSASVDGLRECVSQGLQRIAFLGGSIELVVKVNAERQAARVWAAESTLGERGTEKCMFEVLRGLTWPKPVGGAYGIARNAFEFDPRKGLPSPAAWDAARVEGVLQEQAEALAGCRQADARPLLVTLYIGAGGRALAAGASSSEDVDETAVDCVMATLLAAQFPEPEQAPTKVRFTL